MAETNRAADAAGIAPRDEARRADDPIVTDAATDVDIAVRLAAASGFERSLRADRARWLTALAEALEAHRQELVALAAEETQLSAARLTGEVTRTVSQLRFFAGVAVEGSYVEATLDSPDDSLTPPRPDLRRMLRPLGVVAVFAASNFPFAFSVLGTDTASALAAGCPVVVKAHPGHPRLSRRVAELGRAALAAVGAPASALALVDGFDAGAELVRHPLVSAVGFTGSTRGGRALFDLAAARPAPIPFYGELGSINPVVVTAAAAAADASGIASGLAGSFTRDGGQYCTKPGLVFVPEVAGFEAALVGALAEAPSQALLTDGIASAFDAGSAALVARDDVELVFAGERAPDAAVVAAPVVVATSIEAFTAAREVFLEECFGPLTVLVRYADEGALAVALAAIEGSLTGTIQHAPGEDVAELTAALGRVAGRVVFNGWPTGVAIAWAQHHGGSWPATTASVHSSVGATAIRRWLTPIAYQDAPAGVLPPELADGNPLGIPRREDGLLVTGPTG
ncbi:aldehyde dehydrogenase (NADP(+)) [Agromyces badenianii]|uniref:Aldehyde dehydrogenase (NADP(+)) n=1 Tax=Agromyces badenianii TaxID=2080742 RepID=A0A2S0WTD7_9MICO|nr:aldehyde dehydrogenase family protein [Agromyces badenianii]AWB94599.1 aldehyde dehydrogenase (NADP(+)) [Agromyces badenianii]